MLQSAVVLPEESPAQSPPSLKRRQSSLSSDSSKRPRLGANNGSPPSPAAMSPPPARRQSSATSTVEDRKRSQRLFGALLGNLSAPSARPQHRRRDEIEQRQRDKLRATAEADAEVKRKQRAALDEARQKEQQLWNEQGVRLRRTNERARARFLLTKSEPRLYYKPWELTSEEEERIKHQIDEAEGRIRKEMALVAAEKGEETGMNEGSHSPTIPKDAIAKDLERSEEREVSPAVPSNGQNVDKESIAKVDDDDASDRSKDVQPEVAENNEGPEAETSAISQQSKPPDDHSHDELVEGHAGEDEVIY